MIKQLLDTNICIYIIKQQPAKVLERFLEYQVGELAISSITLAELRFGVAKSAYRERNAAALDQFLIPLEVTAFDDKAASVYGEVRAALERGDTVVGAMDLLIAAHAIAQGAGVVTNNVREFSRIPGLRVLNWAE